MAYKEVRKALLYQILTANNEVRKIKSHVDKEGWKVLYKAILVLTFAVNHCIHQSKI